MPWGLGQSTSRGRLRGDPDRAPYRGWAPLTEADAAVFLAATPRSCAGWMCCTGCGRRGWSPCSSSSARPGRASRPFCGRGCCHGCIATTAASFLCPSCGPSGPRSPGNTEWPRPGCVSRVSGSTPPAESKKIHAKDSRTSRAVGCPSRCPSCAPRHSTICDCRPPWREDLGPDWLRFPIARLHRTTGLWFLYWRDQNLKYHRYQPLWLTTSMTVQIPPSGDHDQLT